MPDPTNITTDPDSCSGAPCVRDLRVRVADVLSLMAHGHSAADVTAELPYVTLDDVRDCLAYAAAILRPDA